MKGAAQRFGISLT